LPLNTIRIYTDGSCHTQLKCGAWAAIIYLNNDEHIIKGIAKNTTHNRMELQAIINALQFLILNKISFNTIEVFTDSQYAVNLTTRKQRILENNYLTKKGTQLQNTDLLKELYTLLVTMPLKLIKVAAHQPANINGNQNRRVDLMVRALMRETILNA
jgi:ribonuclease HI